MIAKNNTLTDKIPHDEQAEMVVIGSILISHDALHDVKPILNIEHFWEDRNKIIYEAMVNIYNRGEMVDQVTVAAELDIRGKLKSIGGHAYLSEMVSLVPTHLHAAHFANIVKNRAIARNAMTMGHSIETMAQQEPDPIKLIANIEKMFIDLQQDIAISRLLTPHELAKLGADRYGELAKGKMHGIKTGFYDLDDATGGFYGGELVILGSRPGLGKTTTLVNIAQNMGKFGKKGLLCSLEQRWKEILDRMMGSYINKSPLYLREGGYNEDMANSIIYHLSDVDKSNIYLFDSNGIIDNTGATTGSIFSVANHMKYAYGLDYIMVDYLGLIDDRSGDKQYERISEITRKLKRIAMNLDVPVIVACQLNRQLEQQIDKRPQLADLRDSGSIEQDADIVMFLYRDDYYRDKRDKGCQIGIAQLILAKQRQGGGSEISIDLKWNPVKRCYENLITAV